MNIFSVSKQQYPSHIAEYAMHISTGKKANPYIMIPLTEDQYESFIKLLENRDVKDVEVKQYSTIIWMT